MLVDDERLARQGLRDLLQEFSDVEIVGEADTAASAVAQIPALSPDVIFPRYPAARRRWLQCAGVPRAGAARGICHGVLGLRHPGL